MKCKRYVESIEFKIQKDKQPIYTHSIQYFFFFFLIFLGVYLFSYLIIIYGCVGSSFLCEGFL